MTKDQLIERLASFRNVAAYLSEDLLAQHATLDKEEFEKERDETVAMLRRIHKHVSVLEPKLVAIVEKEEEAPDPEADTEAVAPEATAAGYYEEPEAVIKETEKALVKEAVTKRDILGEISTGLGTGSQKFLGKAAASAGYPACDEKESVPDELKLKLKELAGVDTFSLSGPMVELLHNEHGVSTLRIIEIFTAYRR